MQMIPVFKPSYNELELEALREPFKSGWIGLGPVTAQFESKFSSYIGVKYSIGTNSCTSALHLALSVLNVVGAEVITTPITFVSTNHAILYNNAVPVFCDVEPDTLNIDANKIPDLITPKTKGIIVVHYGGHSCDMEKIFEIAKKYRLFVIEDTAHGCGGYYKDRKLGSMGDIACFSFHAVKNLATGEGGMITTNNPEWDHILRKRRWMGISKDTWKRSDTGKVYDWFYNVEEIGFKFHMNDVQAALGLVQLQKLDGLNERRRKISEKYIEGLADLDWIELPIEKTYAKRSWHNFVIKVQEDDRDNLMYFLKERGVSTSVHYYPNHLYDLYKAYRRELPNAEYLWKRIITLPLFPDLADADVVKIIDLIRSYKKH